MPLHSELLELPAGFPVGFAIGTKGRHIRDVQSRTGARISVNAAGGFIHISGTAAAVAAAADIYRKQFAEHQSQKDGSSPVVPLKAILLISPNLAQGVRFKAASSEDGAEAITTGKQLYLLEPSYATSTSSLPDAAAAAGGVGPQVDPLAPGAPLPSIAPASTWGSAALEHLVAAVDQARDIHAGARIKLRFNLGRQLFASRRIPSGHMSLVQMQGLDVGYNKDVQCFFSNSVPIARLAALEERLVELGFSETCSKRTATVHLYRRDGFAPRVIKFRRPEEGGLEVRKLRTGYHKLFFLSHAHGDDHPDFRLKLQACRRSSSTSDEEELLVMAASCKLEGARIKLPSRCFESYLVDCMRFNDKRIFHGTVQLPDAGRAGDGQVTGSSSPRTCTVRVLLCNINDDRGMHHMEVGGSCLELSEMLAAGAAGTAATGGPDRGIVGADCLPYVEALLRVCRQLRTSM